MSTLMQAVERLRDRGAFPARGPVSVKDLEQRFHASPPFSVRSLILKMFASVAVRSPWAVILCRFKGLPGDAGIENYIRSVFAPGTGGMVEYWRDVSLGAIDITGSRVFGWIELELNRDDAGMGTTTRSQLIDYAVSAAQRDGHDPIGGFHSQIAVVTHQWSKDGAPAGADWQTPGWTPFWINGGADGSVPQKRVLIPPPMRDGTNLAHEMGHGFGMEHDVGSDMMTHYADPCCIMSQQNSFRHATWQFNFGPALCLPHLIQRDWMYKRRVYYDDGAWLTQQDGITLPLAPITDPGARANLGIKLFYQAGWEYYLEYIKPNGWSQGIVNPFVFIRRMGSVIGIGETPIYLGSVAVPTELGRKTEFIEPSGNVRFRVERFDADGRVLKVAAKKL